MPAGFFAPPPYSAAVITYALYRISPDPRPAQEAAARRIGVRITLNHPDQLSDDTSTRELARICVELKCVFYRRYCGEGGSYCGFAYAIDSPSADVVTLEAFQVKATSGRKLEAALHALGITLGDKGRTVIHFDALDEAATDPAGCAAPKYLIYDKPTCPADWSGAK